MAVGVRAERAPDSDPMSPEGWTGTPVTPVDVRSAIHTQLMTANVASLLARRRAVGRSAFWERAL